MQMPFPGWRQALIESSIETLRQYEPADAPYAGCFSGGKDSVVIKELARLSGVSVEWHYNVTTIDPPELTQFIKREHPDVMRLKPPKTFVQLIETQGLPTRRMRWCCKLLKESTKPNGRRMILGVRAAESARRAANWQVFTFHRKTKEYAVLPILHWKDADVWQFIRERHLPYCKLYDSGRKRLGCIMCPMAPTRHRVADAARYPAMAAAIYAAGQARWERMVLQGSKAKTYREFSDFCAFWHWWLSDEPMPGGADECQGTLEFWSNE
jgi:phosphoadenosine phosphosulfate reductase